MTNIAEHLERTRQEEVEAFLSWASALDVAKADPGGMEYRLMLDTELDAVLAMPRFSDGGESSDIYCRRKELEDRIRKFGHADAYRTFLLALTTGPTAAPWLAEEQHAAERAQYQRYIDRIPT